MKEIGGYFGLENFRGNEFYNELIPVNNGRNALAYLLKLRRIQKLYIPYFLCDSIPGVCQREGCPVEYYHISNNFLPQFDKELHAGEWIYIVNFYGQITNRQIIEMKEKWKNVIFDNVQAFFQKPVPGIDTIYSCRKFFGVPDGGYLATDAPIAEPLPEDMSRERMKHVLGRYEADASEFYADFKANNGSFAELEPRAMSRLTHNLLRAVDYDWVMQQRNANFNRLHELLGEHNSLPIRVPDGPYAYPFYCKNGMELKRKLAEIKIYVATLWPNVLDMECSLEKDYAENILPIPCDQRYGIEEMDYLCRVLSKYC